MGVGSKLKNALSSDKDTKHSNNTYDSHTANTHKTPGSFPSDDVPRTYGNNTNTTPTTTGGVDEPTTTTGTNNSDYTYGHGGHGSHGVGRDNHVGTSTTQHPNSHSHNKLSKGDHHVNDQSSPYWGESRDRDDYHNHQSGVTGGTGTTRDDGTYMNSRLNDPNGTTAGYGRQGPHTSGTANKMDPTIDSDASGARMGNTAGDYGGSGREGAQGPHNSKMANAADPRVDSDRDASRTVGNAYGSSGTAGTGNSPGYGSSGPGVAHRPADTSTTGRDHKLTEYDAPTNSEGRGHTGNAALAGGVGAAEMARRHHDRDLEDVNGYGGAGGRYPESRGVPHEQPLHGAHNNTNNVNNPTTTGHHNMMPGPGAYDGGSNKPSMLDPQQPHAQPMSQTTQPGYAGAGTGVGPGSGSMGHGNGVGGVGGSSGMGEDHFGPGHAGAKVMHTCHNCGVDNDISGYFKKQATYRMA